MTRAWDKEEKIWVFDGNRTHDLPSTGRGHFIEFMYDTLHLCPEMHAGFV